MELIIISGRSGSGKSVALRALEDIGYYCVDNIPLPLIPQLVNILSESKNSIVVSIDIRNSPSTTADLDEVFSQLPEYVDTKFIFLDSDVNTLIHRYSDSRRLHPLANQETSLESAIKLETKMLEPLHHYANYIIDTSEISAHALAGKLRELLKGSQDKELRIIVESFGFKHGLPMEADYVLDVRFLPNPYWDVNLRAMTGLEQPVIDFLEKSDEVKTFIAKTNEYLDNWIPALEKNNRSYLTIAIGCTGGKHRSVYIAEQLYKHFKEMDKNVNIRHRSLEKAL